MHGQDSSSPDVPRPDADTLMDYALGFLDAQQAAQVEAALAQHPEARAELNAYLSGLSDLVLDLPQQSPPQGATDRLLARLNAEVLEPQDDALPPAAPVSEAAVAAPARRPLLLIVLGVAAALVLLVAVLPALRGSGQDELARYRAQPGAVASVVSSPSGQPLADVVRLAGGRAYVQISAALPSGKVYQAWKIEGGKPVSLGLFQGRGFLASLPAGTVFAVTLEPPGGSPQPTSTPLFAKAL
ncbi:anti-sigma factor domain-containing protein [Deinococcus sp.]|uniref:anti-sigma factor n=1 Tax=Deinococcus sp. TaxID=47478 RepID=UPI003CC61A10